MARSIVQNYTFTAASRVVTLTDFSASRPVRLDRLQLIINATTGAIIYNAADATVATAAISSNNVVTLSALAGTNSDTDKLTVIYDTLPGDPGYVGKVGSYATPTTVLSTELNSLGNNGNTAAGTAFDNSVNRYPLADLIVNVAPQGSARTAGATIGVYMVVAADGTNYDSVNEVTAELAGVVLLDSATTARQRTVRGVELPPGLVKFFARNLTGQALAASGNTVAVAPYYRQGA